MPRSDRSPKNDLRQRRAGAFDSTGLADGETNISDESLGGTVNGTNPTFTIANTPVTGTLHVYRNGLLMRVGASNDYTLSGTTITFNATRIPPAGAILWAEYVALS